MGFTPKLKLPYPELTDILDGPDAIGDLATATEDYFLNRILPVGIDRAPAYHWGAGTTYPSGSTLRVGDTYVHTGLGPSLMRWNGGAWRQAEPAELPNNTAITALANSAASSLYYGFAARDMGSGRLMKWNNTRFVKASGPAELIANAVNGAGSGLINPGGTFGVQSITVPAHAAGMLHLRFHGSWISAANAASISSLYYGPGIWFNSSNTGGAVLVPGSGDRQHNNGNANVPIFIASAGRILSDGSAGIVTLTFAPDSAGNAIQLYTNSFDVWLEAAA